MIAPSTRVPLSRGQRAAFPTDVILRAGSFGRVDDQLKPGAADAVRDAFEQLQAERLYVAEQDAEHIGAGVAQALRTRLAE